MNTCNPLDTHQWSDGIVPTKSTNPAESSFITVVRDVGAISLESSTG